MKRKLTKKRARPRAVISSIDSMSEADAGGSGASLPSLPEAIEQWEMLRTEVALRPSRFELHAFTSMVCGRPLQVYVFLLQYAREHSMYPVPLLNNGARRMPF